MVLARRAPLTYCQQCAKCQHTIQPIWKPTSEGPPSGTSKLQVCVCGPCETPWPNIPPLLTFSASYQASGSNQRATQANEPCSSRLPRPSPPSLASRQCLSPFASVQLEFDDAGKSIKVPCSILYYVCKGKGVFAEMRGICEYGRLVAYTMRSVQNKWLIIAYRRFIFPRAAVPRRDLRYATNLGRRGWAFCSVSARLPGIAKA